MNDIEIFIQRNVPRGTTEMFIISKGDSPKNRKLAKPMKLEFAPYKEGCGPFEPSITIPDEIDAPGFLRALSEALIAAGYRDKAISKDGEINRIEKHLEDMRNIAFTQLKIPHDGST